MKKRLGLLFIAIILLFCVTSTYASNIDNYESKIVLYDNSISKLNSNNVKEAIDELKIKIDDLKPKETSISTSDISKYTYKYLDSRATNYTSRNNAIDFYLSYKDNISTGVYTEKIIVKKQAVLKGEVSLSHNKIDINDSIGTVYIGFSTSNELSFDDYDTYISKEVTNYNENNTSNLEKFYENFSIYMNTPGEYYIKIAIVHSGIVPANTIHCLLKNLKIYTNDNYQ